MNRRFLFFRQDMDGAGEVPSLPEGLTISAWHPSLNNIPPRGLQGKVFWVWWIFHVLHVFRTRNFSVVMIADGSRIVHRSGVFPAFFRFPFMQRDELQVGETWTDPAYRGKGLALAALRFAQREYAGNARRMWYIVEDVNVASIRVIQKAGFALIGSGARRNRLGVSLFGYYAPDAPSTQ